MPVPLLIFTRFSILTPGDVFNLRGERYHRIAPYIPSNLRFTLYRLRRPRSLDDRRRFLFDERRLAERFWMFEHIALASLANQNMPAFRHVVLTSTELPGPWRDRLDALAGRFGFTVRTVAPEENFADHARDAATEAGGPRLITARLDDDDALSRDYVETLQRLAETPLDEVAIIRPNGLQLILSRDGSPEFTATTERTGTQGLAVIETVDATPRTIFGIGGHTKITERMPTIRLPAPESFVVTSHIHNNSARFTRGAKRKLDRINPDPAHLRERFGLTMSQLETYGRDIAE